MILVCLRGGLGSERKSKCYSEQVGLGELECEMLAMVEGWWYDKMVNGSF